MAKMTPWFPPEVKPVRKGWYACDICTRARSYRRHYFDGKVFRNAPGSFQLTVQFHWRGLAEPPK